MSRCQSSKSRVATGLAPPPPPKRFSAPPSHPTRRPSRRAALLVADSSSSQRAHLAAHKAIMARRAPICTQFGSTDIAHRVESPNLTVLGGGWGVWMAGLRNAAGFGRSALGLRREDAWARARLTQGRPLPGRISETGAAVAVAYDVGAPLQCRQIKFFESSGNVQKKRFRQGGSDTVLPGRFPEGAGRARRGSRSCRVFVEVLASYEKAPKQ